MEAFLQFVYNFELLFQHSAVQFDAEMEMKSGEGTRPHL